jgi:branched-chain amino acid transport system substrate-binding protein
VVTASSGKATVAGSKPASSSSGPAVASAGKKSEDAPAPAGPGAHPGTAPAAPAIPPLSSRSSPVLLGNIGDYSGPAGVSTTALLKGIQMWVKTINAQGGLRGHQVKLLAYDAGADPSRHRAAAQDAVERAHVVAFLGNVDPVSGNGSVEYITQKRIPVVGTSTQDTWSYTSPMYFPQASAGDLNGYAGIAGPAQMLVPAGITKIGTVVCVEAAQCSNVDQKWSSWAKSVGFEHVYRAKASLAQPDFTAECLSAQRAGAQALIMAFDANSYRRFAASCARQGYKPVFAHFSQSVYDGAKDDPNIARVVSASNVFLWFQSGTPATDEYQRAVERFGATLPPGAGGPTGWAAGKLLERAVRDAVDLTTASILQGLWTIKDDDLGGVTQPLTFVENEPATATTSCWFNLSGQNGNWSSPDGFKLHCSAVPA